MHQRRIDNELSEDWGAIRAWNLFLQYGSGILGMSTLRNFDRLINASPDDGSPVKLGKLSKAQAIGPDELYFASTVGPKDTDVDLLVRFVTDPHIWQKYEPTGNDPNLSFLFSNIWDICLKELHQFNFPFDQGKIAQIEKDVRENIDALKSSQIQGGAIDPVQSLIPAIKVRPKDSLTVLGTPSVPQADPRFVTPLSTSPGPNSGRRIRACLKTKNPADWVRDVLGLDHLGEHYNGRPNVLSFIAWRFSDLKDRKIRRPTPFDDPSPWRFRGVHGNRNPPGHSPSGWGATVRLDRICACGAVTAMHDLYGAPEAVVADSFLEDSAHVYLGFVGVVRAPRGDHDASPRPAGLKALDGLFAAHLATDSTPAALKEWMRGI